MSTVKFLSLTYDFCSYVTEMGFHSIESYAMASYSCVQHKFVSVSISLPNLRHSFSGLGISGHNSHLNVCPAQSPFFWQPSL